MTRVVLMEDYADQARHMAAVRALAGRVELQIHTAPAGSEDELLRRLQGAAAVITIRDRVRFSRPVFERVQGLRLLSVCGPRLDPHVDLEAATRAGVLVFRSPANTVSREPHHATAELAWALILGLAKDVERQQATLRQGGWQTRLGLGLYGKTLGVVGSTGKVGRRAAAIGRAMGMRVLAWSPRLTPALAAEQGVEAVSFETLLREADVVTLHANATADSAGLFGAAQFALMKPGALLVNTARAALVDEQALRAALDSGHLGGAGLDVYWQEPLPADHWVRRHERVLMQPHLGGFTPEGYEWIVTPGVEAVLDWLDGKPLEFANPQAAPARRKET